MFGLDDFAKQYFRMLGMIAVISGAVELVIGVFGLRFRNSAEKTNFLFIAGIVQLVVAVFSTLYTSTIAPMGLRVYDQIIEATMQMYGSMPATANLNATNLSGNYALNIVGFILPVLFIVGTLLNRLPPKAVLPVPEQMQAGALYAQQPQQEYNPYTQPLTQGEGFYTQQPPLEESTYTQQQPEESLYAQQPSLEESSYEQQPPPEGDPDPQSPPQGDDSAPEQQPDTP